MNLNANRARFTRMALLLASSVVLFGQGAENGQVTGHVLSKGKPVVGAKVLVRSPQLISPKTVYTNADGNFRVPLLPPGGYVILVTAEGYKPWQNREELRLGMGAQLNQNVELATLATQGATVEVMADVAGMDKADPKTSVNYSSETLTDLPTFNRSFEGAADLSPGISTGPLGAGTTSIRGGAMAQSVYNMDGVSVGDDVTGTSPYGAGNTFTIEDAIEDTQVILSPLHAKYGRSTSGVVNVATKSGGNDFSGSFRYYLTRNDWQGLYPQGLGQTATNNDFYSSRNLDVFVSGPLIKDHVWFTFSTILSPTTNSTQLITDESQANTAAAWGLRKDPTKAGFAGKPIAWIPGTAPANALNTGGEFGFNMGSTFTEAISSHFYQGKLTWAITPDHTIQLERSFFQAKTTNDNAYPYLEVSLDSDKYPYTNANEFDNINYKGVLASNFFVEASLSNKQWTHANTSLVPEPHVRLYQTGVAGNMVWPYGTNTNPAKPENNANDQGSINFKWLGDFHGSHEVDFGAQYYESKHWTAGVTGLNMQRFYVYGTTGAGSQLTAAATAAGVPVSSFTDPYGNTVGFLAVDYASIASQSPGSSSGVAPTFRQYTGIDGWARSRDTSIYVNDVYQPDQHWTYLFGLREDKFRATNTDGSTFADYWGAISPRFSAKYDIAGDSARVISFSLAKYVSGIPAAYLEALAEQGNSDYSNYGWTGANYFASTGGQAAQTATWVPFSALTNPANYSTTPVSVQNSSLLNLTQNLSSPYMIEAQLGYRRSYRNGSYVSVNYVNRSWHNDAAIKWDTDPTAWGTGAQMTSIPSDWVQVGKAASGTATYDLPRIFFNSPDIQRKYNALELEWKEIVTSRLSFGGSYTYSRLTGNDNGGDSQGEPGFANNANSGAVTFSSEYYTFRNALMQQGWTGNQISPDGVLQADQTQKARIFVTYSLPVGAKGKVDFSLLGRYDSGYSWSAQDGANGAGYTGLSVPVFQGSYPAVPAGVTGLPSAISGASFSPYYNGRGQYRMNDTHTFDATINLLFPIWGKLMFTAKLDIKNVFNTMVQGVYDNALQYANYGNPGQMAPLSVNNTATFGTANNANGVNTNNWMIAPRYFLASMGLKF